MKNENIKDEAIRKFAHDHVFNNDPSIHNEPTQADKTSGLETNVLIVREGTAPKIEVPKKVEISGTIRSLAKYIANRISIKKLHDTDKIHVLVDRENFHMQMKVDESSEKGTYISGKLEIHPNLAKFQINTGKRYNNREMFLFFRETRAFFPDKEAYAQLIAKLSDYSVKLQTDLSNRDDLGGNTLSSFETKIENSVPLSFKLESPIFKGEPKKTFFVDILVDVSSRSVSFCLDSIELREMIEEDRDKIINEEIEKINAADVLVIEQ